MYTQGSGWKVENNFERQESYDLQQSLLLPGASFEDWKTSERGG